MEARDQLRYMYGPGGLSEQLSGLAGVGVGDMQFAFSPAVARALFAQQSGTFLRQFMLTQASQGATVAENPPSADAFAQCNCMMDVISSSFDGVDPGQLQQLSAACQADPTGFASALQAQAQGSGVSLDLSSCGPGGSGLTPWYKRPTTWAIGGGIVVLLGLAAWGLSR